MDRIRLGMVGGGTDAFIGAVHRIASRIDDRFELVAGALSSTPEKARTSGAALGLAEDRSYGTFEEMAEREAAKKELQEGMSDIAFGSQIRSYVFQPYTMVNDHRTEVKITDVHAVSRIAGTGTPAAAADDAAAASIALTLTSSY